MKYIKNNAKNAKELLFLQQPKDNKELDLYRSLWRAIIFQAVMDATTTSKQKRNRIHKIRALKWLSENSSDFKEVCQFAGLNPGYIRQSVLSLINQPKEVLRVRAYRKRKN
jgi:hypothetical protein